MDAVVRTVAIMDEKERRERYLDLVDVAPIEGTSTALQAHHTN
jgi:hypothetical protein